LLDQRRRKDEAACWVVASHEGLFGVSVQHFRYCPDSDCPMIMVGVTSERPRWVGIDYGRKRVGLAIADPLRIFAQPLGTYSPTGAVTALRALDESDGVELVVIGWPLLPDGEEGEATREVAGFIKTLEHAFPSVRVVKWDERYTSELAAEKVREVGPNRKWGRSKGRIDAAAAAIMLQEYMEAVAAGGRIPS